MALGIVHRLMLFHRMDLWMGEIFAVQVKIHTLCSGNVQGFVVYGSGHHFYMTVWC